MAGLVFLLVFWVLAGACQRHGVGVFFIVQFFFLLWTRRLGGLRNISVVRMAFFIFGLFSRTRTHRTNAHEHTAQTQHPNTPLARGLAGSLPAAAAAAAMPR